ncbi:uncharacterized protein G2W53_040133 [Senna tora]|uniref:Uncharacterized protein n=1 Tax=Senna tora TaxID=362788 RepID=A0A834SQJ8_9FABA|nr:uncharacterized protein G2W53_040133 [Senna tora]
MCVNASRVCGRREIQHLQEEAELQKEKRWSQKKHVFSDF